MAVTTLIELDDRRRAQLGRILPPDAPTRYAVSVDSEGVITLSPARVITEHELRLLSERPDLAARMRDFAETGIAPSDAAARRRNPRPDPWSG